MAAASPVEIRVAISGAFRAAALTLLPDFERDNPGIRVRVQQVPWSAAHEKLLTAYVGDAVPDVLQAGNTWLPELVALEALEPESDELLELEDDELLLLELEDDELLELLPSFLVEL